MARTKEFDVEQALDAALGVFWRKGYEASSIQDLVDATGVNRASLYETFGNKRDLFLKALDRFETNSGIVEQASVGGAPGLARVRAALVQGLSRPRSTAGWDWTRQPRSSSKGTWRRTSD